MKTLEALVNPFGKEDFESPDNIEKVEFDSDEKIAHMLEQYHTIEPCTYTKDHDAQIAKVTWETLSPLQIDSLLQMMKGIADKDKLESSITGSFLTKLIHNSVKAGNTEFVLTTGDAKIHTLIEHDWDFYEHWRIPKVKIVGNAGNLLGRYGHYTVFDADGDVGDGLGWGAYRCVFNVKGSTGKNLGRNAKSVIYNIGGDVEELEAQETRMVVFNIKGDVKKFKPFVCVENCIFNIEGRVRDVDYSFSHTHKSMFRLHDKSSYEKIYWTFHSNPHNSIELVEK